MGCGSCSTGGGCSPAGCKSNGSCLTNGCSKLDVYDWLSNMDMPSAYKAFPIVEIKFKGSRKDFYLNTDNTYLEAGELVVTETPTGGFDVGHVSVTGELVRMQMVKRRVSEESVAKKILRKATPADVDKWKAAKDLEWETMHKARKLALELGLQMKLSDVDYQGDRSKATFYYTAEGRVDFRELIKRMAETFRIRIEMRQIGMRQEASRLGGIGSCGRELCCSTWLTDFKTVSTSAARYQNLSLNTLKLAGQCGKLKCCLNYELDTYMDALKYIPDYVNYLKTQKGDARLQKTDIFKKLMWFTYPGGEDWVPLHINRVKEIQQMNKDGILPEDLGEPVLIEEKAAKVLDYENVVGQDSLTVWTTATVTAIRIITIIITGTAGPITASRTAATLTTATNAAAITTGRLITATKTIGISVAAIMTGRPITATQTSNHAKKRMCSQMLTVPHLIRASKENARKEITTIAEIITAGTGPTAIGQTLVVMAMGVMHHKVIKL